eukprot:COSAG06_NODE_30464_length_538_cov_1.257403_1_plen_90_part_00
MRQCRAIQHRPSPPCGLSVPPTEKTAPHKTTSELVGRRGRHRPSKLAEERLGEKARVVDRDVELLAPGVVGRTQPDIHRFARERERELG